MSKKAKEAEQTCHCQEDESCTCGDNCACHQEDETSELLSKRIKELEDALMRSQAELLNYRKRKDEETQRILKYANEDLVLGILPAVDNFERAIKLDDQNLTDELSKFLSGFKLIYGNMVSTLEKFDVKPIDKVNVPFDPAYHQGVLTEKVDGMKPDMVIDIMQKGYILKDKVIRHAMVKVSE